MRVRFLEIIHDSQVAPPKYMGTKKPSTFRYLSTDYVPQSSIAIASLLHTLRHFLEIFIFPRIRWVTASVQALFRLLCTYLPFVLSIPLIYTPISKWFGQYSSHSQQYQLLWFRSTKGLVALYQYQNMLCLYYF